MSKKTVSPKLSSLLLFSLTLLGGGLCRADLPSVEVPFDWKGGHIVVRGSIGDLGDLNLVIDTGASSTVVSRRLARKLGLRGKKKEAFAYGHKVRVEEVRLPSLQMGSLLLEDVPARTMDRLTATDARQMLRIDALVGLDLLARTSLTIDYESQTVRFGPVEAGDDFQPFYPGLPFLVLRVSVGDQVLGVMLDSGAEDLILYRDRVEQRLAMRQTRETKDVRHAGGRARLRKVELSEVRMGEAEWPELEAFLMEGRTGNSGLDGVLGIRSLGLKKLSLDFQTNRIGWER